MGGYSYGSLITTRLPPIEAIIGRFACVSQGTAEAGIRLRASSLAVQWNRKAPMHGKAHQGRNLKSPSMDETYPTSTALAMGGAESDPSTRRGTDLRSLLFPFCYFVKWEDMAREASAQEISLVAQHLCKDGNADCVTTNSEPRVEKKSRSGTKKF